MHNNWEEQIPFYIAGTLPKQEATQLENHVAHCDECRTALEEWRLIAGVIRADAASQLRDLPPLSARVLQVANGDASIRRYHAPLDYPPEPPRSYRSTSLTLVAAVFTVILLGGLMAFIVARTAQDQGAGVALLPSPTPTASTVAPTLTPTLVPSLVPSTTLVIPSVVPSLVPSQIATTVVPSIVPTEIATTVMPSIVPSLVPTQIATTVVPSVVPSKTLVIPSVVPSVMPSATTQAQIAPSLEPQIIVIEPSNTPIVPTATHISPTLIPPTHVVPTRVIPTRVPPTRVVPTPIVPTAVIPTAIVPTAVVPTVIIPTAILLPSASATPLTFQPQALLLQTCTVQPANANGVSLYSGAGMSYPVIKLLSAGDQVTVLGQSGDGWYQVEYDSDSQSLIGWLQQALVVTGGSCANLPTINGGIDQTPTTPTLIPNEPLVLVSSIVNLRSGPGRNYPIIGTASSGQSYPVIGKSSSWYEITLNDGSTAWVSAALVTLSPADAVIQPASSIPPTPAAQGTPVASTAAPSSGVWTQTMTVTSSTCPGAVVGTSQTTIVTLTLSGGTVTMSFAEAGAPFTLMRASQMYVGSYTTSDGSVAVSLVFNSAASYSVSALTTQNDGCTTASSWNGLASP